MQQLKVTNCYLALGEDESRTIPIAECRVKFTLNQIPRLTLTPALGRSLRDGSQTTLKQVQRGERARVYLGLNGRIGKKTVNGLRLLLDGWVQQVALSDTSTLQNRWIGGKIVVSHRAAKLAGSPAVSYVFGATHDGTALKPLGAQARNPSMIRALEQQAGPEGIGGSALFPINRFLTEAGLGIGVAGVFPTELLKHMVIAMVAGSEVTGAENLAGGGQRKGPEGVFTREEITEIAKAYDPANLSRYMDYLGSGYFVAVEMMQKYLDQWATKNLWQGLRAAADYMMLSIIPYNKGFYIGNPCGWLQTPDIAIGNGEYTSLRQFVQANVTEPVDGVVVKIPPWNYTKALYTGEEQAVSISGNSPAMFYYPPLVAEGDNTPQSYSTSDLVGYKIWAGEYYHFRAFPEWLHPAGFRLPGRAQLSYDRAKKGQTSTPLPEEPDAETLTELGSQVAQLAYSQAAMEQGSAKLVLPYREDLMPGTRVSVATDSAVADTSFVGTTIYGMVHDVEVYCSTVKEQPVLQMEVSLTHLRGEEDNRLPENDGFALEQMPIYEGAWTGIDLYGEHIADVPAGEKPETLTTPQATDTEAATPAEDAVETIPIDDTAVNDLTYAGYV